MSDNNTPVNNNLLEYRDEIDKIDHEMVDLFRRRMETAAKIAQYKREVGKPVFDPVREREKLNSVAALAGEDMNTYSDYTLSKLLGITQNRISSLKVKKELIYPYQGFDRTAGPAST